MDSVRHAWIVATYGRRFDLRCDDGTELPGRVKGRQLRPVCGDRVVIEPLPNEPDWLIASIMPRSNELNRPDRSGRIEVLAANIDFVAVVAAPLPEPDWFIVDRYLCAAALIDAKSAVVFNKRDLGEAPPAVADTLAGYAAIGHATPSVSARHRVGLAPLSQLLAGHTAIFVGQSGVGKSSLVNALLGNDILTTAPVSVKRREGRHTTVTTRMRSLPDGGRVIDSPGVRDYSPAIETPAEVARGFPEIYRAAQQCRFADCAHLREPACEVTAAVNRGDIDSRRYESYRRLYRKAEKLRQRRLTARL